MKARSAATSSSGDLARRLEPTWTSQQIEVSAEAFDRFVAALDAPQEMPTVRRYAGKRSQIPAR